MPEPFLCGGSAFKNISNVIIRPLRYGSLYGHHPSGFAQVLYENDTVFYQLNILHADLSLSESVYAVTGSKAYSRIPSPDVKLRQEISKTSSHVSEDFIVPNRSAYQATPLANPAVMSKSRFENGLQASPKSRIDDQPTIGMEWLRSQIRLSCTTPSDDSIAKVPVLRSFEGHLEYLQSTIEDRIGVVKPGIQSMLELADTNYLIPDIDSASAAFLDLVESALAYAAKDLSSLDLEDATIPICHNAAIPNLLTPALQRLFGIEGHAQMSHVYDSLVQAFISPLPPQIPGRTRIAIEKVLREGAASICLASHGIHNRPTGKVEPKFTKNQGKVPEFLSGLPVRRKALESSLITRGKERARFSSPPLASSLPASQDIDFVPSSASRALPTPEPTPSVRSHTSVCSSSASEDPSSLRLRSLTTTDIQVTLPIKMRDLLAHWTPGADPSQYTWDPTQQRVDIDGKAREPQTQQAPNAKKHDKPNHGGAWSQPLPQDNPNLGSSQKSRENEGIMSQPQPGLFGTRQVKSSKGKKNMRPAGFK